MDKASTEANPKMQFSFTANAGRVIKATHSVTGKVCASIATEEFSLQPEVVKSEITLCYQDKQIPLEPNLKAGDVVNVLDEGGQKLNSKATLQLSPTTKFGVTTFTVRYQLTANNATVEKQVAITVNRLDETVKVTVNPNVMTIQSAAEKVSWIISINNGQTTQIKQSTDNPLFLKPRSEAPLAVEIAFIIAADIAGGNCKWSFTKVIPAAKYNELMKNGGTLEL